MIKGCNIDTFVMYAFILYVPYIISTIMDERPALGPYQSVITSVFRPTSCLLFLFQVSAFLLEFMFWKAVERRQDSSVLKASY